MALNLLNSFGKKGTSYGLYTKPADIIDSQYLSQYFIISEFDPIFSAGKNSFSFNGSSYLKSNSPILVECIDANKNTLYMELASPNNFTYKEASAYVFSVYVYNDTADGVGQLILYGTLADGKTVKWIQNITINKTLKNHSRVRFYQAPSLEVDSAQSPVLSSSISNNLIINRDFTGVLQGLAVIPTKDINISTINIKNVDIDYRLTLINPICDNSTNSINSFNSQMIGSTVDLHISKIQSPAFKTEINTNITQSFIISNVLDNNTLQISIPFFSTDQYGNQIITNISKADFSISYPFINYNNSTSSYQTSIINGKTYIIEQSYADIIYRNIRTFSGYVARHKIYRKSLLSNADLSVVADEPIVTNEILADNQSQNKFYNRLGKFYNGEHLKRYWFTSSLNLSMSCSPSVGIDSTLFSSPIFDSLSGIDYYMAKNDSVPINRNATYIPFDNTQFLNESGSAYDSNFMEFKANVQYIIQLSTTLLKNHQETRSSLSFYITSSIPEAKEEKNYTSQFGINIATMTGSIGDIINYNNEYFFFTPKNDIYGTLVIVPKYCQAYIKNISVRVYGDDGFSPDLFITRIPWPISVANESFEIKSELFDINNSLVYSDIQFKTFQSFDVSGSSIIPFFPGGSTGSYMSLDIPGTLTAGTIIDTEITARSGNISQSRILAVRDNGTLVFTPLVDTTCDDKYLYVSTGSATNRVLTDIDTKKSLASEYGSIGGRKIYWVAGVKTTEMSP